MRPTLARAWLLLIFAAAAALLGIRAAGTPLLDPDESRFARTSVEMARSHDLVVPTFQGEPRLVKPPLFHWIQSWLFGTFGTTEWLARLPSIAATLAALLLVGWVAHRRFGGEAPLWAAAAFATMPLVVVCGRLGTLDALLALHILAVLALDIAEPDAPGRQRALAVGAILGLGFLVKGPVGVVLPLLMALAGRTAAGREILPTARALVHGTLGFLAVVLPWTLALLRRVGVGGGYGVLRHEALERYLVGTEHLEPIWFFLPVAVAGMFPWGLVAALGIGRAFAERRDPVSRTARYVAAAALVGLVFFSLGRSKLPTYLLPLAPLLAIVTAWELGRELKPPRPERSGAVVLAGTLTAAFVALVLAAAAPLPAESLGAARSAAVLIGLGAAGAWVGVARRSPRVAYASAAAGSVALLGVAVVVALPVFARTRTTAYLIDEIPALRDPTRPVLMVEMKVPSLTFYLDRRIELVPRYDALSQRLDAPDDPLLVIDVRDLGSAAKSDLERLREVGRQGKYRVFEKLAR